MPDLFQEWHIRKADIHGNKPRPFFHEREVWFAHAGWNIGYEQNGKGEKFLRPVLVVRKFNQEMCWVVPLTSKIKDGRFHSRVFVRNRMQSAILSQMRLIDSKRLVWKIQSISTFEFQEIREKLKRLLA